MNLLPSDLMAKELSYLSFDDVTSLCKTNSKYHNFCMINIMNFIGKI